MADARKTFPMSVFTAYIKGENLEAQKRNVAEMLGFMTKKDVDDEFFPFAAALSKAFAYEQHPELAKMKAGDVAGLGDSVSVVELPADVQAQVDAIFEKLACYRTTIATQKSKIDELESSLADASAKLKVADAAAKEYKAKADQLEASAKSEGDKVIVAAEKTVTELGTKMTELSAEIEKAKAGIIAILKAAPAAGGAGAAEAVVEEEAVDEFDLGNAFTKSDW